MENSWILGAPIFKHIIIMQYALILGHLKMINFPFGTNGKLIILGVPILMHITVVDKYYDLASDMIMLSFKQLKESDILKLF